MTIKPVPARFGTPEQSALEFIVASFKVISAPVSGRTTYTNSRVGTTHDGKYMTVLNLLANELYPGFDEEQHFAYWVDGNWRNETWDNVSVLSRRGKGRPRTSYGVPAGTPEYHARYRAANRDKIQKYNRDAAKRYRTKVGEAIKAEKAAAEVVAEAEPIDMIAEILAAHGGTGEPE